MFYRTETGPHFTIIEKTASGSVLDAEATRPSQFLTSVLVGKARCRNKLNTVEAGYRRLPINETLVVYRNRGVTTSIVGECHHCYTGILCLIQRFDRFVTSVATSFNCKTGAQPGCVKRLFDR